MRRLCLVVVGVAGSALATQAVAQTKHGRAQAPKAETVVPQYDALALNNALTDPYGSPVRGQRTAAQFPPIRSHPLVEPQGGFSLRAGRDNPNEPMTGGLKFRF